MTLRQLIAAPVGTELGVHKSAKLIAVVWWVLFISWTTLPSSPSSSQSAFIVPNEIYRLVPGRPQTRKIAGTATHLYKIRLEAHQVFAATVTQRGIDLALIMTGPNKTTIGYADSPNGAFGAEEILVIADVAGEYLLEIKPFDPDISTGGYTITSVKPRAANAVDRERYRAYRTMADASDKSTSGAKTDLEAAIKLYEDALQTFRRTGDPRGRALADFNLGSLSYSLSDPKRAITHYENSLPFWRSARDYSGEANILSSAGLAMDDLGMHERARLSFERGLTLIRRVGDRKGEADALNNSGRMYAKQGRFDKAISNLNAALAIFREFKNPAEANLMANLGAAYAELGEYDKALELLHRAIPVLEEMGDQKRALTDATIASGDVNFLLADYKSALSDYDRALAMSLTTGDRGSESQALNNIGKVYMLQKDFAKSEEFLERASGAARLADDRLREAYAANNIGQLYMLRDDRKKAFSQYQKALNILRGIKNRHGEARALNNLGSLELMANRPHEAIGLYSSALALNRDIGERADEGNTLANLMIAWTALRSSQMAIYRGKEAVNVFQSLRGRIRKFDVEQQRSFLGEKESVYRHLAQLLIENGRLPEAELVLRMLKEEEYSQFSTRDDASTSALDKRIDLTQSERDAIKRYEKIADEITRLGVENARLEKERNVPNLSDAKARALLAQQDAINEKLKDARTAVDKLLESLKLEFGRQDKRVASIEEGMQADVKAWADPGAVVVSTIVGKDNLSLIVTTTEIQTYHIIPVSEVSINRLIGDFRAALTDPESDPKPAAQKLYDVLVKPLEKDLAGTGARTLIWSLDGNLRYIPMAALWDKEKGYLVQRYSSVVISLASRGSLAERPAAKKNWNALGVGVSKAVGGFAALTHVADELDAIITELPVARHSKGSGILSGRILMDDKFTSTAFRLNLGRYPIVHAATHFSFISGTKDQALKSFLLLGGGERLTLEQIQNSGTIFNGVQLLALSACDTAFGGKDADGREIEGFGALAQKKGAKAVMATLWRVADESTRELMVDFYKTYKQGTISKAEAMRRSQLALLNQPDESAGKNTAIPSRASNPSFTHPYYWSPYILIGNWR